MGNVILGIIAVICFIGLALAGASYLGTTMTAAKASTNAANIMGGLQEIAGGVRMYAQKNKGAYLYPNSNSVNVLISQGYLKASPINPIDPTSIPYVADSTGQSGTSRPVYAILQIGAGTSGIAQQTCIEIERASNNKDRLDPATMATPIDFSARNATHPQGCFRNSSDIQNYIAYYAI